MEQKVAEAQAKDESLEEKINEKIAGHAADGWTLREIYVVHAGYALLLFEREGPPPE